MTKSRNTEFHESSGVLNIIVNYILYLYTMFVTCIHIKITCIQISEFVFNGIISLVLDLSIYSVYYVRNLLQVSVDEMKDASVQNNHLKEYKYIGISKIICNFALYTEFLNFLNPSRLPQKSMKQTSISQLCCCAIKTR